MLNPKKKLNVSICLLTSMILDFFDHYSIILKTIFPNHHQMLIIIQDSFETFDTSSPSCPIQSRYGFCFIVNHLSKVNLIFEISEQVFSFEWYLIRMIISHAVPNVSPKILTFLVNSFTENERSARGNVYNWLFQGVIEVLLQQQTFYQPSLAP